MRGDPFQIFVRLPDERRSVITVWTREETLVTELKDHVRKEAGIDSQQEVRLCFGGRDLTHGMVAMAGGRCRGAADGLVGLAALGRGALTLGDVVPSCVLLDADSVPTVSA